jgi:protein O-mannosyl-transferase
LQRGVTAHWAGLLVFFGVLGLVWWSLRRTKLLAFGFGFYFFTVALVLQVISVGAVIMADRYTYLPYWGLFFMLGYGLYAIEQRRPALRLALWGGVIALALLYVDLSRARADVWQNHDSLWGDVIKQYPKAGQPRQIRGHHYGKTGRIELAIADFEAALANNFRTVSILEGLGNAYGTQGKVDRALAMFNEALALDSTNISVRYNRAVAQSSSAPQKAIKDLDYVIANSLLPKAVNYGLRGFCNLLSSNFRAAEADYSKAIELDAKEPYSFFNRGQARHFLKNYAGARQDYEQALRLKPGMPEALQKLQELQKR